MGLPRASLGEEENAVRHGISVVNKSKTHQSGVATIYPKLTMSSLWDLEQIFYHFLPILYA